MCNIDLNNIKKSNKFFLILLIVGISILIVLVSVLVGSIKKEKTFDSKTTSTFIEVKNFIDDEGNIMYSIVYHYEVNGQNYECSSNSSSSHDSENKNNIVYYDSKKPSRCVTEYSKSNRFILILFLIISIAFVIYSVVCMVKTKKMIQQVKKINEKEKLSQDYSQQNQQESNYQFQQSQSTITESDSNYIQDFVVQNQFLKDQNNR